LDGQFGSSDLVSVFQAGQYEDSIAGNSTWSTGDWNGDADFDSGDLVLAFQDGGYEKGPLPATQVPEPTSLVLCMMTLPWLGKARRLSPGEYVGSSGNCGSEKHSCQPGIE
jgi:hypothetical protein